MIFRICIFFGCFLHMSRSALAACACHKDDVINKGCTACPASWYNSCSGDYANEDGSDGGAQFMWSWGCNLRCKCSNPCKCREVGNVCRNGGDSAASCVETTYPGYSCSCSTGFHVVDGVCVDRDACSLDSHTCQSNGDSAAQCVDMAPPAQDYRCDCSYKYYYYS